MIVFPSGELSALETEQAQFFLAVRSIIFKQTKGNVPNTEVMNSVVEKMVEEALNCTGIKNIIGDAQTVDLFSEDFLKELDAFQMPITKFNALLKAVRKNIDDYGRTNKVKSDDFDKRLKKIVDSYNSRDKFANVDVVDFVEELSARLIQLAKDLEEDKTSFERLGVTCEEKNFFDILIAVRDEHGFHYAEESGLTLAKKIKQLVDDNSKLVDWSKRTNISAKLESKLMILLNGNDYPSEWTAEVFGKIMEQTSIT